MEKNIEIEFKLLLTKEQYQRILPIYDGITPYRQINYYYDTKQADLRKKIITLRVRFKNNKYEFTLKRFGLLGTDEFNEPIDEERYQLLNHQQAFDSQILDLLEKEEGIRHDQLYSNCSLTTDRYDINYQGGVLSLDYNQYLGKEDYELEYEVPNREEGLKIFREFLKQYDLVYTMNCHGKRQRVLEALDALNDQ